MAWIRYSRLVFHLDRSHYEALQAVTLWLNSNEYKWEIRQHGERIGIDCEVCSRWSFVGREKARHLREEKMKISPLSVLCIKRNRYPAISLKNLPHPKNSQRKKTSLDNCSRKTAPDLQFIAGNSSFSLLPAWFTHYIGSLWILNT